MMLSSITKLAKTFATHPLTRDAQLAAWGRFLKWQFASRFHREIVYEWVGGQCLIVERGMTGATGNIYLGLHEFYDMAVPLHFLRPGDLFLDIGANVGTYTILASGICGADTMAFEPDPVTAARLKRNVEVNGLGDRVSIFQVALGASEGEIRFTTLHDTMNRIAAPSEPFTRAVKQTTLDNVISGFAPAMMKLDVEGAEESVFAGAMRSLSASTLKVVETETLTSSTQSWLEGYGFSRASYNPFDRTLNEGIAPSGGASNALFVRDISFVRERLRTAAAFHVHGWTI